MEGACTKRRSAFRNARPLRVVLETGTNKRAATAHAALVVVYNPHMPTSYERLDGNDEGVVDAVLAEQEMVARATLELRIALSCFLRAAASLSRLSQAEQCVWLMCLARRRPGWLAKLPRDLFLLLCDEVLSAEPSRPTMVDCKLRVVCETGRHASVALANHMWCVCACVCAHHI